MGFMLVMPLCFARLGIKRMLLVGMSAWASRYLLFAFGAPGKMVVLFYLGILLHGVCYDFFFVTGQIYVDGKADPRIRAGAQGFITLLTYGLGMLIGSWVSGWVVQAHETRLAAGGISHAWMPVWLVPAAMAGGVFALFLALFKPERSDGSGAEVPGSNVSDQDRL